MRYFILYIAILLLFACKKEIHINVDDHPARLVVNADLDPDSFFFFNLSLTQNITDNKPIPYVTDANIEIFNKDTIPVAVLQHTARGNYRANFSRPQAGELYYFRINTAERSYWFKEHMPDTLSCSLVDTSRGIFQGKEGFFQVRMRIVNPAGNNYYGFRIKRHFETYEGSDTLHSEEWVPIEIKDVLTENPKSKFSKKNLLFTDETLDPQHILRIGAAGLFSVNGQRTTKIVVYTTSYTKSGYDYYTSLNEHLFYQNDPFSQPTLLVGNIPDAYGAAVGKFTRVHTIKFK